MKNGIKYIEILLVMMVLNKKTLKNHKFDKNTFPILFT